MASLTPVLSPHFGHVPWRETEEVLLFSLSFSFSGGPSLPRICVADEHLRHNGIFLLLLLRDQSLFSLYPFFIRTVSGKWTLCTILCRRRPGRIESRQIGLKSFPLSHAMTGRERGEKLTYLDFLSGNFQRSKGWIGTDEGIGNYYCGSLSRFRRIQFRKSPWMYCIVGS